MQLSFHGGMKEVTGSSFLLEFSHGKLLVDCGLFQGERICGSRNLNDFDFDPAEVDAVLVTHAHYDHTGRLPKLVKAGFSGPIYATPPTQALMRIILEDAHHLMVEQSTECGDPVLYDQDDLARMLKLTQAMNYHTQFEPLPGVKVMFHDAGHILGSAFISIDIPAKESAMGEAQRLIFSGDLGNDDVPILPDTEDLHAPSVVVCESTYGNRDHEPTKNRNEHVKEMVNDVVGGGGTLIIPAFSLERTQELLYTLDGLIDAGEIPDCPIYLDSPLAIKATEIYRHFKTYLRFDRPIASSPDHDFFSFDRLIETLNVQASKKINADHRAKIIIAGSGMMTGGRVQHHLMRYLPSNKNGVLIIGYQASGTLGRRIQEGASMVTIFDKRIPVRAQIKSVDAFSAHGDRGKIRTWLQSGEKQPHKVLLVHGDPETKISFQSYLKEQLEGEVLIPEFEQRMEL